MATSNDLKNGMVLSIENQLWSVIEFQHVKPGKGPAFVRTKLRNVTSGKVVDKTFNAGIKIETANVDRRDMQYLYNDGSGYVFMDSTNYEQITVDATVMGETSNFLLENQLATVALHEGTRYMLNYQHQWFWRSPSPSLGCRGIAQVVAPSPQPSRPVTRFRCHCLSRTTPRSR